MKARNRPRSWSRLLLAAVVVHFSSAVGLAAEAAGAGPESASQLESDSGGFDAAQIGASTLDVVILRPLGALATVAGLGFFAVSAPFVAPSRDFGTSWDIFVVGPAEYTFVRPVGTI